MDLQYLSKYIKNKVNKQGQLKPHYPCIGGDDHFQLPTPGTLKCPLTTLLIVWLHLINLAKLIPKKFNISIIVQANAIKPAINL